MVLHNWLTFDFITRNGTVFASSRDVAAFFGKRHDNVLKVAEDAIASMPAGGLLNFQEPPYTHPQNGQTYRMYEMTKDGFVYLTMGFTGTKAAAFKIRYIEEFNRMEAQLKTVPVQPALPDFMDPERPLLRGVSSSRRERGGAPSTSSFGANEMKHSGKPRKAGLLLKRYKYAFRSDDLFQTPYSQISPRSF